MKDSSVKILTIDELMEFVPDVKALEGKSFSNLKELLESLVSIIEESDWEFVQYIPNQNPSLFIIRKRQPKNSSVSHNLNIAKLERRIKKLENQQLAQHEMGPEEDFIEDSDYYGEEEELDVDVDEDVNSTDVFGSTKLPWE